MARYHIAMEHMEATRRRPLDVCDCQMGNELGHQSGYCHVLCCVVSIDISDSSLDANHGSKFLHTSQITIQLSGTLCTAVIEALDLAFHR